MLKNPLRRALLVCLIALGLGITATGCNAEQIAEYQRFTYLTALRDGTGGYRSFSNCADAVDYIFGGRWDHGRARMVTHRESRDVPTARRPGSQYAGCAQLSAGIRASFLKGPWEDPYYNVLAMRDAVDHPEWGWCHWDSYNYCAPGGQF